MRPFALALASGFVGIVAFAAPLPAAPITIPNPKFASPDVADGAFSDQVANPVPALNWLYFDSGVGAPAGGVWDPQSVDYAGSTGNNLALPGSAGGAGQTAYLYLDSDGTDPLSMGQRFTTTDSVASVQSNTRYTLTIALGNSLTYDPGDVSIEILFNDDVVASELISAGTLSNGTFTDVSTSYDTAATNDPQQGNEVRVRVVHTYSGVGIRELEFTNVRLDAALLPEPASGLTAFALIGMTTIVRRRRRRYA